MALNSEMDMRTAFSRALKSGNLCRAMASARSIMGATPRVRDFTVIAHEVKSSAIQAQLEPFRVALLSSFSLEFIHDVLFVYGFLNGLGIEIYQAGFAQYRQEILDPASRLYSCSANAVILALEGKDVAPALYRKYMDSAEAEFDKSVAGINSELENLVSVFRKNSETTLLIHNFAPPTYPALGILDAHTTNGQIQAIHRLNQELSGIVRKHNGVYVVDYSSLVARFGALNWYDDRMSHYAKAPISHAKLPHIAAEYMKHFRALTGRSKKCLVLDLDNTLWGGVLGEDGPHGIQLGPNYPGSAYVEFQHEILNLYKRGVILAIASKNNSSEVDSLFASHAYMVLKKEHFSEMQIHWRPKSESIVEIARRLNLGLDHIVFMDDSPAECEQVASALPMVTTRVLPKQPEQFIRTLLEEGLFDTLSLSAEDRHRSQLYQQRAQAEQLQGESASLEDFYRGLAMEVEFAPLDESSLIRATQLTQKTNQFNATTRRFTEAQMAMLMHDSVWWLRAVRVRDRFGDNGIVGLIMVHRDGKDAQIENFLLSCRVIGRTVETAMLAYLNQLAMESGIQTLRGRIIPTQKNQPVRDLYKMHGFEKIAIDGSVETEWILPVREGSIRFPAWIKVRSGSTTAVAVG